MGIAEISVMWASRGRIWVCTGEYARDAAWGREVLMLTRGQVHAAALFYQRSGRVHPFWWWLRTVADMRASGGVSVDG